MDYRNVVRGFYERADANDGYERKWGYGNPSAAAYWRLRDELVFPAIVKRLHAIGYLPRILEIGSGHGHELAKMSLLGIPQSLLTGADLLHDRISVAKQIYGGIGFAQQAGERLAFADETFDVVCQFTCLMHIPTGEIQSMVCSEMGRVLKPGGMIIWWDIAPLPVRTVFLARICQILDSDNGLKSKVRGLAGAFAGFTIPAPRSADVHNSSMDVFPTSPGELSNLFPGLQVQARYSGLEYGVWEFLWQRNRTLAAILWRKGWFPQHCFAIIQKI